MYLFSDSLRKRSRRLQSPASRLLCCCWLAGCWPLLRPPPAHCKPSIISIQTSLPLASCLPPPARRPSAVREEKSTRLVLHSTWIAARASDSVQVVAAYEQRAVRKRCVCVSHPPSPIAPSAIHPLALPSRQNHCPAGTRCTSPSAKSGFCLSLISCHLDRRALIAARGLGRRIADPARSPRADLPCARWARNSFLRGREKLEPAAISWMLLIAGHGPGRRAIAADDRTTTFFFGRQT